MHSSVLLLLMLLLLMLLVMRVQLDLHGRPMAGPQLPLQCLCSS